MKKWLLLLIFCVFAAVITVFTIGRSNNVPVISFPQKNRTVILDAGHGGEDGGASGADGTLEKDINLYFTENIALYFDLFGIEYAAVRNDDRAIGDLSLQTIRERKVSDLHKRMDLVNKTPDSILLSIHQNFYSSPRYCGTQVFYAASAPGSKDLAQAIQNSVIGLLQPDNHRSIKPTEGTVYLLDKAENTSVMVECGFLSNAEELSKLKDITYRSELSYAVTRGLLCYLNSEKEI